MEPLERHEWSTVNSPEEEEEGDDDERVDSFTALAQTSIRVVGNERNSLNE